MPQTDFAHYPAPPGVEPSPDFAVTVNGESVFVYPTAARVGSVASVWAGGAVEVAVRPAFAFERVVVRPRDRDIRPEVDADGAVRFAVPPATPDGPMLLSVEFDGRLRQPLFLFVNPSEEEEDSPDPDDPNVRFFGPGAVHEAGRVELTSGQTLYIAGGAVLRANVVARDAENVAIRGRGILDGNGHTWEMGRQERLVHLAGCRNVRVEGVTILNGRTWQVVPAGCDGVTIRGVKIVSSSASDDGIDVVSSRNVTVDGCFVRTKDDCVAIKGVPDFHPRAELPVEDVRVENCVFWNGEWGNALEIGYETRVDAIRRVTFHNCDILRCEAERFGSGGALTIHNGDRAVVSDVLYEDIRIEDCREKLIDFKICFDRYSRDAERGQIRGVTLRDVRVVDGPPPVSILQGFDGDHLPQDILLEDVAILGQAVRSAAAARLVTEKVGPDVRFRSEGVTFPLKPPDA